MIVVRRLLFLEVSAFALAAKRREIDFWGIWRNCKQSHQMNRGICESILHALGLRQGFKERKLETDTDERDQCWSQVFSVVQTCQSN